MRQNQALSFAVIVSTTGFDCEPLQLLEPIGYIPPAEAEINYYQQLAEKTTLEV
ncbi:hypothetical protein SAMN05216315_12053 [Nitrosospira sp. Nsp18]|nr:hypothetical protein SAMN05216315_12053 [Nitrosospira sp. Nsp18]